MTKANILVLIKTSWRRREDVFWRRMSKANIFILIKTSWRRLLETKTKNVFKTSSRCFHQDECLLRCTYKSLYGILIQEPLHLSSLFLLSFLHKLMYVSFSTQRWSPLRWWFFVPFTLKDAEFEFRGKAYSSTLHIVFSLLDTTIVVSLTASQDPFLFSLLL